jgi:hypothetical protein
MLLEVSAPKAFQRNLSKARECDRKGSVGVTSPTENHWECAIGSAEETCRRRRQKYNPPRQTDSRQRKSLPSPPSRPTRRGRSRRVAEQLEEVPRLAGLGSHHPGNSVTLK